MRLAALAAEPAVMWSIEIDRGMVVGTGVAVVFLLSLYHIYRRRRLGEPVYWMGDASMSTPSQILMLVFLGTVVMGAISGNAAWIAVALIVFAAGATAYVLDWHRHWRDVSAIYDRNVTEHESAFSTPPAKLAAEELPELATFKLYNNNTAEYLCTLSRSQLQELISKHQNWGLDPNEFLIMGETIEKLEEEGGHSRLSELLREILGERGSIEIRWTLE